MSEFATENISIAKQMEALARARQAKTLGNNQKEDRKDTCIAKFNPKLFNQFLNNVYLCGGHMK